MKLAFLDVLARASFCRYARSTDRTGTVEGSIRWSSFEFSEARAGYVLELGFPGSQISGNNALEAHNKETAMQRPARKLLESLTK
ncbi:MAG TPA: hypothetical protein VJV79_39145, partial [Polyangiaceae bacterium]|nr:hypothetical protein [Polyangiaceae bacterium]